MAKFRAKNRIRSRHVCAAASTATVISTVLYLQEPLKGATKRRSLDTENGEFATKLREAAVAACGWGAPSTCRAPLTVAVAVKAWQKRDTANCQIVTRFLTVGIDSCLSMRGGYVWL